ncbi:casein kinase II beta chain, putative [Theileria equi strain WA]|uniref:Casein kinase II subunit beta n=1 Tax=Theileria equi strain WA TaxID=1537102 RepID=L1LFG9_THEEQ|nr:casein kinase II beta chain, putative [Theileria equi strain WA]EKX74019.1 casein kinase II beta chain, putative [Theileria equi strain WA]|eukprot:XP_004833471.1 casein kinase II beta chain, putative [Theileria equi strain WA]
MLAPKYLKEANKTSEDIELLDNDSDSSEDSQSEVSWIEWYCNLKGNQYYIQVDEAFIRDEFNLVGLQYHVTCYTRALQLILDHCDNDYYDNEDEYDDESNSDKGKQQVIDSSAQLLYGLIHSRFIITNKGMQLMMLKYKEKVFGTCPNFSCENTAVLPVGLVDAPSQHTAKVFCPNCNEVYHPPKNSRLGYIDGAFYGTTFAHLFLMVNESIIPRGPAYYYVPKVYGYRISPNIKENSKAIDLQDSVTVEDSQAQPS